MAYRESHWPALLTVMGIKGNNVSNTPGSCAQAEAGNFQIDDHLAGTRKPAVAAFPNTRVRSVPVIISPLTPSTTERVKTESHHFRKLASPIALHFAPGLDVILGPHPASKALLGSLARVYLSPHL